MRGRALELLRRSGWIERTLVALVLLYGALRVFAPAAGGYQLIASMAVFLFALLACVRLSRSLVRKAMWRLRNRLIAAYLFIAVVPISLLIGLASYSGFTLIGQVAAYLVRTQLTNRQAILLADADMLVGRRGTRSGQGRGGVGRGPGQFPGQPSGVGQPPSPGRANPEPGGAGRRPSGGTAPSGRPSWMQMPNMAGFGGRGMPGGAGRMPSFAPPSAADQAASEFNRIDFTARGYAAAMPELELVVRGYTRPAAAVQPAAGQKPGASATAPPAPRFAPEEDRRRNEIRYPETATLTAPPSKVGRDSGFAVRTEDGRRRLYLWAHSIAADGEAREATLMLPVTGELLSRMVLQLNRVWVDSDDGSSVWAAPAKDSKLPARVNLLDSSFIGWYIFQATDWDAPERIWGEPDGLVKGRLNIHSRLSTVLGIIFEQRNGGSASSELLQTLFLLAFALFLIAEVASVWAGIKISRTMTVAVHELYEGTERVKEGDFQYRIPVKSDDQLADLSSSFNQMTERLGGLVIVAKEKERLQSELEIAREVQKQLFPRDVPSVRNLELKGVCKPARVVSGDYYDFLTLPGSEVAFAIGDVAGKGISAALLMASIQSAMRMQLTPGNGVNPHDYSAASLVSRLNRQLYATTTPEKYATFYFALYDEAKRSLTYTNAGHLSPLLVRQGDIIPLTPTGTVVGAFPFAKYEERTVELMSGDILLAYTDGIVEPENPYGEMYGENRLKDLLLRYAYADSAEIIARSMEAVNEWTGSSELQDDMTMIVARQL